MTKRQFAKAFDLAVKMQIANGERTKDGKLTAKGIKAFRKRAHAIIHETPEQGRKENARVRRIIEML